MALVRTTLSSALTATATSATVASATSIAAGYQIVLLGEVCKVAKSYVVGSTTVPLLRGQGGTASIAHASGAGVVHGSPDDPGWGTMAAQSWAQYPLAARARENVEISTTPFTLVLPSPGSDLLVNLIGTSVITLTIPVPTKAHDGTRILFMASGVAAHIYTFTGGLSGAGSSYDLNTVNATAPIAFEVVASNSLWLPIAAVPLAGTVTNITGTIS